MLAASSLARMTMLAAWPGIKAANDWEPGVAAWMEVGQTERQPDAYCRRSARGFNWPARLSWHAEQRGNRTHEPPLANRIGGCQQELGPVPHGVLQPGRVVGVG